MYMSTQNVILVKDSVAYLVTTNLEVSPSSIKVIEVLKNENSLTRDDFYEEVVKWLKKNISLIGVVITPTKDSYDFFESRLKHYFGKVSLMEEHHIKDFPDDGNEDKLKNRIFDILHRNKNI